MFFWQLYWEKSEGEEVSQGKAVSKAEELGSRALGLLREAERMSGYQFVMLELPTRLQLPLESLDVGDQTQLVCGASMYAPQILRSAWYSIRSMLASPEFGM